MANLRRINQEDLRNHNLSVTLDTLLRAQKPMSRADLAKETGLTKATLSLLASMLTEVPACSVTTSCASRTTCSPLTRAVPCTMASAVLQPSGSSSVAVCPAGMREKSGHKRSLKKCFRSASSI